jgi:hypothetical protein
MVRLIKLAMAVQVVKSARPLRITHYATPQQKRGDPCEKSISLSHEEHVKEVGDTIRNRMILARKRR